MIIDGRVVFASCEDDQGGIVTSEVVKSGEGNQMKTVVKTQHGDKMELVTDNNGNKIRTQGQIKTRDEKLTLWKVRFSLFLILILIFKIFRELLKLLKNFVLSIL